MTPYGKPKLVSPSAEARSARDLAPPHFTSLFQRSIYTVGSFVGAACEQEERVCAWWDDAAPTHFITSACRGCAAKHVKDTVVGTFVDRRNES